MAQQLGVNKDTIRNWEVERAAPARWQWPELIRFLGYVPFSVDGALSERLKAYRRTHGRSQKQLALQLGVDPGTLARWEDGRTKPGNRLGRKIEMLLAGTGLSPTMPPLNPMRTVTRGSYDNA